MKYSFSALTLTGLLGLTAPVEAGLRAACRSQCAPLFAQECGGLCGRPSRKCRAGIVQDCRHFLRRYHWPLTSLCRARPDVHGAWRFDGTLVHDGCALARDLCVGITTRIGVATQEAESVGED